MAWATLNGLGVIEARVELPRVGAWVADLAVDTDAAPAGAVTLDLNGFSLKGTVRRGGVVADTAVLRVVGGAGGLPTELAAFAYRGVPLKIPLQDVLTGAGEALDSSSDLGVLSAQLDLWLRRQGRASAALWQLLRQVPGASWRVQPNGQTWVGREAWSASRLTAYELLREDPSNGREVLFADTPSLVPGTVFRGRNVSFVEHLISEDQLRTVVWYET